MGVGRCPRFLPIFVENILNFWWKFDLTPRPPFPVNLKRWKPAYAHGHVGIIKMHNIHLYTRRVEFNHSLIYN